LPVASKNDLPGDARTPVAVPWELEDIMEPVAGIAVGSRRNEDIALDLMKFVAITTGYGKTGSPGAGFQDSTVSKAEDYAGHLLELYARCLAAVQGGK